jgi:hypothetical protein
MRRGNIKRYSREFFYFLSALVVLGVLFELVWPNSVLAYLNFNYILVLWVIFWLSLL